MNYTKLLLVAYNGDTCSIREIPDDCFHVTADLGAKQYTQAELMAEFIKPMTAVIFSRLIPEMPQSIKNGALNPAFLEWEQKYYGALPQTEATV